MKTLTSNPNRSVQTNHLEEGPAAPARPKAPGRAGRFLQRVAATAGIAAACGTASAQTMSVGPFGNSVNVNPVTWQTAASGFAWWNLDSGRSVWTPTLANPEPGFWQLLGPQQGMVDDSHTLAAPFIAPAGTTPWGNVHLTFDLSVSPANAMVNIFTFLGQKNGNYAADVGPMTGFDPSNIPAFTGHTITGGSGTPFVSDTLGVFNAEQLPGLFPQFNMTAWIGGHGPVTVLSTTMPVAELGRTVPTPGAAALLGLGGLMAARRRRS